MKPAQNASAAPLAEGALLPDEGGNQRLMREAIGARSCPPTRHSYLMREAISYSVAIRVLKGPQWQSEAIRGYRRPSEVIRALSLWKARSSSLV